MGERDDRPSDEYERDLERANRRERDGSSMADLPDEIAGGPHGAAPTTQPHVEDGEERGQHGRKGQAESPVELNHYDPPKKRGGHR
ncbi:MAG: hypothetical protein ACJ79S_14550 [Gemmatimonadaceae bacterium]